MRKLILAVIVAVVLGVLVYSALFTQQPEGSFARDKKGPDFASVLANISDEGFERPSSDWKLELPEDHGAHVNSRTETWQLHTHLRDDDGNEFGFQFLFLRIGIVPPTVPPAESVWDVRQLERVHIALLDANSAKVAREERFGRGIPSISGFDWNAAELRMDNWFLSFADDGSPATLKLYATISDKSVVEFDIRPVKQAVALEPDGADAPFVGYSITRLTVDGTVDQGQGKKRVTGTAWYDHLWGELPVPGAGPVAWDRLQLQLEDGAEISAVRSRRIDGRGAASVNGAIFEPNGEVISLDEETIKMTAFRTWQSPYTGVEYPIEWQLEGPDLDITIEPLFDAQVLDFSVPLWSGLVRVKGSRAQSPVSGFGTLQLTGYEQ
ncbi:lipocalin family protein [Ruegeria arenilitoris]|uniref:lipocalin family protein n=1 Tax=Ruegeria arenilitoris TaxID=1173585 RepID=UPI0014802A49|nr:lipocalin family protein [Ruegeria arenilitoris]